MAILDNCYWRTENSQNNKLGKRTAHLAVHWPVNLMFRKVFSLLALLAVVALSSRADTAAEYQV
jgi:hypothetical protein